MNALEITKTLVSIPSVNPFRYFKTPGGDYAGLGTETKVNLFVEDLLKNAGFQVTRQQLHAGITLQTESGNIEIPPRWNVLGVKQPKGKWNGKSVLFYGHTDTVDVKNGWKTDPFSIEIRNVNGQERWYGLGANDMKGGLSSILDAVASAHSENYALKAAFLVDEEYYSFGADHLVKSEFMNDVVLAIAPEIGDTLPDSQRGSEHQLVGIGRTGREEYEVTVTGNACHGADAFLSKDAINAVHESAAIQVAITEYFKTIRRKYTVNNAEAINSAFISYQNGGEAMLSVPDKALFVIDRTFLPDESPKDEIENINRVIENLRNTGKISAALEVKLSPVARPTASCKPYICSMSTHEIGLALNAVKNCSRTHSYYIGRSVADENRIAEIGIPTLIIGPYGAGSHTSEEWVDPKSIIQTADIFKNLISSL